MSKKYMPKDVFEGAVCVIAKHHVISKKNIEEFAIEIWDGYSQSIINDGVVNDMTSAASSAIFWLNENNSPDIGEFFHHFQYFCMNFDDNGNPKKKKIFNGLWFSKSIQDNERVENYMKKLRSYYIGAKSGIMPLSPEPFNN